MFVCVWKVRLFRVEDGVDGCVAVWLIEDRTASNEHVGTAVVEFGSIGCCYTAIHFDEGVSVLTVNHVAEALYLAIGVLNEFLSTEARVDAHEEHEVGFADDVFKEFYWSVRIEGDTGFHACIVNTLETAVEMGAGFVVHVHDFRTEGFHFVDKFVWLYNHEVDIKRFGAELCYVFQYGKTERDVRHEDTVHDVDMEVLRTAVVDFSDIVGKMAEVG